MDSWVRNGRPALLAALESVCDTIGGDIEAEIRERDERKDASVSQEISQLKAAAARAAVLQQENQSLRQELEEIRKKLILPSLSASEQDIRTPARPALAEISPNKSIGTLSAVSSAVDVEGNDWEKYYRALHRKYKLLSLKLEGKTQAGLQIKGDLDRWRKYAEALEGKVSRLRTKLQQREATLDGLLGGHDLDIQGLAPDASEARIQDTSDDGGHSEHATFSASNPESGTRSQEDEDEQRQQRAASTAAVVVSHPKSWPEPFMPANRSEISGSDFDAPDELPPMPSKEHGDNEVKIKEEPSSDSPVVVFERSVRKRKPADDDNVMLPPSRKIKSEPSSDPVITNETVAFSPHESIDLDDDDIGMPTPRKQRQTLRGDDEATPQRNNTSRLLYPRPRSGHTPAIPSIAMSEPTEVFPPDRASWNLNNGDEELAEDDFEDFHSPAARRAGNKLSKQPPGRLQTLLNQVSPEPQHALMRPVRSSHSTSIAQFSRLDTGATRPPSEGTVASRALDTARAEQTTSISRSKEDNGKLSKPTPKRLRDTPLAQLRIQDFKINPRLNDGFTFAYDEVVRNKADRAELEGCTDYNCCGRHYRAMAESELSSAGPVVLERELDVQMMEDFLGPGQAHRLLEMTREQRQEVWLKAKSQDMANRFGRHRHRFARKASPPGYWNPDFPDTQEMADNREEAARREKKQVEERWREATKFGKGKWLFRDE